MKNQTATYNAYRVDANTLILICMNSWYDSYFLYKNKLYYARYSRAGIHNDLVATEHRVSQYTYLLTVINEVME